MYICTVTVSYFGSTVTVMPDDAEVELGEDGEDVVADAGNNTDLYAANQGSTELRINEAHTEEALRPRYVSCFMAGSRRG